MCSVQTKDAKLNSSNALCSLLSTVQDSFVMIHMFFLWKWGRENSKSIFFGFSLLYNWYRELQKVKILVKKYSCYDPAQTVWDHKKKVLFWIIQRLFVRLHYLLILAFNLGFAISLKIPTAFCDSSLFAEWLV